MSRKTFARSRRTVAPSPARTSPKGRSRRSSTPSSPSNAAVVVAMGSLPSIRQREGDVGVARLRPHLATTRRDHHVLPAAHRVGRGRGVAARGEARLPEHLAGGLVERAELLVLGGPDEEQAPSGHDGAAVVLGAGGGNPALRQLGQFAEGDRPLDGSLAQVDRVPGTGASSSASAAFALASSPSR